jgi:hypothetical protein
MAENEDRLSPCDGLNNYNVVLSRMDLPTHGGALFTFAVTNSMLPVANLEVTVPSTGQSLDRMTVEAHDALIDILRQLLFRAEKARINHDRNARPVVQFAPRGEFSADDEFTVDRRAAPGDRRSLGMDNAFTDYSALS